MAFDPRYTRWRALFVPQFWRALYSQAAAVAYWPIGRWKALQPAPKKPPKRIAQQRFRVIRVAAPAVGKPLKPFRSFGPRPKRRKLTVVFHVNLVLRTAPAPPSNAWQSVCCIVPPEKLGPLADFGPIRNWAF